MLKNETVKNIAGVIILYLIIILGILAINARLESINTGSSPVIFAN